MRQIKPRLGPALLNATCCSFHYSCCSGIACSGVVASSSAKPLLAQKTEDFLVERGAERGRRISPLFSFSAVSSLETYFRS